jgi:hypothetical protein
VEGGADLVPVTLNNVHEKSIFDYAKACTQGVVKAKNKKDETHNKTTASANFVPSFILQPLLSLFSYINLNLGFAIPPLGIKANGFGHVILTNIGTMNFR